MSERRGRKSKMPSPSELRNIRPSSAKSRTCSDRIIQLALPNLHIVSSVLKDHFKTLSRDQIDRLEKLLDQIKTTKISISRINFIEDLEDFKECDKKKIMELLDGVHMKNRVQQNQSEWNKIRLLPVKSSSDSFLMGLEKRQQFFSRCNSFNRSDRSSTDSSTNIGTYKGIFKKAVASMNFNYRETLYIKLEGTKNCKEQNSKMVQTDDYKTELCQACKKENQEVKVLYENNSKKKSKLRQLHTLLDTNEFLRNNVNKEYNAYKYGKYIQAYRESVFVKEDIQLTIQHLRKLYIAVTTYINFLRNLSLHCCHHLYLTLYEELVCLPSLFIFIFYGLLNVKIKIFEGISSVLNYISTIEIPICNKNYEIIMKERKKRKKQKHILTEGYQISNVPSIVH